ncbi:ATP-dependent helicase [Buchananella hordeovulneris]|uniref:ATP-dependent DNA helicase n=1 Tax=Buchananella hordeovulneris TaxID=52770 RepID=UPI000F5F025C|nr:ATP-dependent DNA helicase [Buchananella hordeovulneris]RRD50850.1 ATP-dependent helicase [Buchananella hordeovulneris]
MLTPAQIAAAIGKPAPTPEQVAVIQADHTRPLLVVAGAGSGKTETMAARVLYLVANGLVAPERILGLTFTRKAAGELAERIGERLTQLVECGAVPPAVQLSLGLAREEAGKIVPVPQAQVGAVEVSTYDAFAAALVRQYGLALGQPTDVTLISGATEAELAYHVVLEGQDIDAGSLASRAGHVRSLSNEIEAHGLQLEQARDLLTDLAADFTGITDAKGRPAPKSSPISEVRQAVADRLALLPLVAEFRERKRQARLASFSEIAAAAARIVQTLPEVAAQIRARYDVVLLDEFQDTSTAQVAMFAGLFAGRGVTAVGDPHQAIYGWRGASSGTLEGFAAAFGAGDMLTLSTAWRNDTAILRAANQVAGPLRAHSPLALPVLQARPGAGDGQVLCARAPHEDSQPDLIAALLRQAWRPEETYAVLCRSRSQFEALHQALTEAGLPAVIVGAAGLILTQDILDLRAALAAASDPTNGIAALRLLGVANLGARDLAALHAVARQLVQQRPASAAGPAAAAPTAPEQAAPEPSLVEAIDYLGSGQGAADELSPAGLAAVRRLARQLARLRALSYLPLPDLVRAAVSVLGLDTDIAARPAAARQQAERTLEAFVQVAAEHTVITPRPSLGGFLAWLDVVEVEDRGLAVEQPPVAPGVIQILTAHASKGLEWDVVVVHGLVEGRFPSVGRTVGWLKDKSSLPHPLRADAAYLPTLPISASMDREAAEEAIALYKEEQRAEDLREERRLAYVAFTRARRLLYLVSFAAWQRQGEPAPSSFLTEVQDLVGVERAAVRHAAALPSTCADYLPPDGSLWCEPAPAQVEAEPALWPRDLQVDTELGANLAVAAQVRHALAGLVADPGQVLTRLAHHADPAVAAAATDIAVLLERQAHHALTPVRLPARLGTTAALRLVADPAAFARDLRRPLPQGPQAATALGTAFHQRMETELARANQLALGDEPLPTVQLDTAQNARLERWLAWATSLEMVTNGQVLAVEEPIDLPLPHLVLSGRIDAVFAHAGRIIVVDWKTGQVPRTAADKRIKAYQLVAYRQAYALAHGLDPATIEAVFAYVAAERLVRVEDLVSEATTAALAREIATALDGQAPG